MDKISTIQTRNVSQAANAAATTYEYEIKPRKDFREITGVSVVNIGAHTNIGIGLFNHRNEEIMGIAHTDFFKPENSERLFPINHEYDDNPITIKLQIYEVDPDNAAEAQVILQLSK